jgi:hypothetical protein
MGATSAYCNECYNKAAKSGLPEDAPIQAAERAGNVPMTKQGACGKCGTSAVVIYYET